MKMLRFSLRSLLVFVSVATLLLGLGPATYDWITWRNTYAEVTQFFEKIAAASEPSEQIFIGTHGGREYQLQNTYGKHDPDFKILIYQVPSKESVWVWPPGERADEPQEALRLLRDNL